MLYTSRDVLFNSKLVVAGVAPVSSLAPVKSGGTGAFFSLLLKYPVELKKISLYPLLGFTTYTVSTGFEDSELHGGVKKDDDVGSNMTGFAVNFGAGADFFLTKHLYIKNELLFGAALEVEKYKIVLGPYSESVDFASGGLTALYKLALGWRFF